MTKKYNLDKEDTTEILGKTLYRIVALVDIGERIKAGNKGGYIESEKNLSQEGSSWVFDDAIVYDNAKVYENARVSGKACVYDNACVRGNAQIYDTAKINGNARVYGRACIHGNARVCDNARVYEDAEVSDDVCVYGNAQVFGNGSVQDDVRVYGDATVCEDAWISGNVNVGGNAELCGSARISRRDDYFCVQSFGSAGRTTTFFRGHYGWRVVCGCFYGTIEGFRQKVKETHGDTPIAQEYLMVADLMELRAKRRKQ